MVFWVILFRISDKYKRNKPGIKVFWLKMRYGSATGLVLMINISETGCGKYLKWSNEIKPNWYQLK